MSLRLEQLEPVFYRIDPQDASRLHQVESLHEAQGIMFLCPKCFWENGCSKVGVHQVMCWFKDRGVPDEMDPRPGRWTPHGTGFHDLSFVGPGATSVLLTTGCQWHGHITCGEVTNC